MNVLQDKNPKVLKLTTVEGIIQNYSKKRVLNILTSVHFKKMIVRVKATVAAGYDLDGIQLEMDSLYHTVDGMHYPILPFYILTTIWIITIYQRVCLPLLKNRITI